MSLLKVEEFILFLFSTTQNVMSAEKLLLEAAVPCMVMPLPTALSASCGLAIRIYPNDQQPVSYTHLDVYKRQGYHCFLRRPWSLPGRFLR